MRRSHLKHVLTYLGCLSILAVLCGCRRQEKTAVRLHQWELRGKEYRIRLEHRGPWYRNAPVSWGTPGPWFVNDAQYWYVNGYFHHGSKLVVSGRVPDARYINFVVANFRASPVAMIRGSDLKLDADGRYEIVFSRQPPGAAHGNWVDPVLDQARIIYRIFGLKGDPVRDDPMLPDVRCEVHEPDGRIYASRDPMGVFQDHGMTVPWLGSEQNGWIQLHQELEQMHVDWDRLAGDIDRQEALWYMTKPEFLLGNNPAYGMAIQLKKYRALEKRVPFIKRLGLSELYNVPGIESVDKDMFGPDPNKIYFFTWYNVVRTGQFIIEGEAPPARYFSIGFHDLFERNYLTLNDDGIAVGPDNRYRIIMSRRKPDIPGVWVNPGKWGVGDILIRIVYPEQEAVENWKRYRPTCRYGRDA